MVSMMKLPGFSEEDATFLNTVMDAIISDVLANSLKVTPEQIAERFAKAALSGERNFARLKAITLGAEKARGGPGLARAN
jgi:hypothetical protein